ncbi:MAG: SDR family NAD(P)-dependent oxidoreductase [Pseudomonadota bacterium]
MGTLDGKVAFITGAGSGIGRGIAERLAQEGADVCVSDVDIDGAQETANTIEGMGRRALVVKANVASQEQMGEAANSCVETLGRLDIAVANAGIGRGGMLLDMPLKDWQDQVDINMTGVFLTVQAAARKMVALKNGGRIVCIASLAAESTGPMIWSYSATKVAVRMMVRGWAQELGPHGITVNSIGPGVIDTPLAAGLAGKPDGAIRAGLESRTPVGRVGKPEDIGGLVNFLVGPDGGFMTGDYLIIDGGLRDARMGGGNPNEDQMAEMAEQMRAAQARREKMQPLLDER